MTFQEWWIEYRGFDDPYNKDGMRDAWNAAIEKSANVCESLDDGGIGGWYECASAIRAMMEPK